MNDELLEICMSIGEVLEMTESDIDKIKPFDLYNKSAIIDKIISIRDEKLKYLIGEIIRINEELSQKNP